MAGVTKILIIRNLWDNKLLPVTAETEAIKLASALFRSKCKTFALSLPAAEEFSILSNLLS